MTRLLVGIGLFVAAHFGLCYIIPQTGPGSFLFPFGNDRVYGGVDSTVLGDFGGMAVVVMIGIAGSAVLAFGIAFLANFGWYVPVTYWRNAILTGALLSGTLYLLHFDWRALAPLAIDAVLVCLAVITSWLPTRPEMASMIW